MFLAVKNGALAQNREWVKMVRVDHIARTQGFCKNSASSGAREWDMRALVQEQQRESDDGKMDMVSVSK